MRKLVSLTCAVLGLVFTLSATNTREEDKSDALSKRVVILRMLNTLEYNYQDEHGRFGDRGELLAYFRQTGATEKADRLDHLQPFQLSVTTSMDGAHYQMSLTPLLESGNKEAWCEKSLFTDERGAIFLGAGFDCEGTRK